MAYRYIPHSFKTDLPVAKIIGRSVCVGCGLARLRNKLTDWCVAKGCDYDEHPDYRRVLRELPARERAEQTGND